MTQAAAAAATKPIKQPTLGFIMEIIIEKRYTTLRSNGRANKVREGSESKSERDKKVNGVNLRNTSPEKKWWRWF